MSDETLVPISSAPRRLGVSERALNDAVRTGAVKVYGTARDRRFRLVRVEDVAKLTEIRPLASCRGSEGGTAA